MKDYIDEQAVHYRSHGLEIAFEDAVPAALVRIDRAQFQRVIENILGNSLKYKDQEIGHVTVRLEAAGPDKYGLSFADDGCGVHDADLPKIFDSFYRTDKARTNTTKGSGLGLAVVQQIVRAMGGTIEARPTQPKGLTIYITLPKGE